MSKSHYKIAVIPGDGIGKEVMPEGVRVLDVVAAQHNLQLQWDWFDFASADYRLNDIDGVTFGVRLGWALRNGSQLILRAEYYTQTGESRPSSAVGVQRAYDLFPTLDAGIFQIEYSFEPSKLWAKK